jgi:hypothetical protein
MKRVFYIFAVLCLFGASMAFADDAVAIPAGLEWLTPVMSFLMTIPAVGAILAKVFPIIAIVAGVFTYLSVAAMGIFRLPAVLAQWAGAQGAADKLNALHDKIAPWLQYLSMFNVQKK